MNGNVIMQCWGNQNQNHKAEAEAEYVFFKIKSIKQMSWLCCMMNLLLLLLLLLLLSIRLLLLSPAVTLNLWSEMATARDDGDQRRGMVMKIGGKSAPLIDLSIDQRRRRTLTALLLIDITFVNREVHDDEHVGLSLI